MSRIEITFVHLRVLTMAWVAPTTVVVSDEMQFPGQFLVGPESSPKISVTTFVTAGILRQIKSLF